MARSFSLSSDFITTPTYNIPAAASMSIWLKSNSPSNAYSALVNHNNNTGGTVSIYVKSTLHFAYYIGAPANLNVDPGTAVLVNATWTHAALTYDSVGGLKTYVNGVSDGTAAANGAMTVVSTPLVFGVDPITAGRSFPGSLADAAEWNLALTAAEILALAKGARPGTIRPASLIGWWPLDGLQSPEPDLSGQVRNGTLSGSPVLAPGAPVMMFTSRWPQMALGAAGGGGTTVFRRSLSSIGTRTGSRQAVLS